VTVRVRALEDDLVGSDTREPAPAAGAVVVGGDDEFLRRIDRLAVVLQVDDAAFGVADILAPGPVRGRLGDIYLGGDAVDDVEVVGRKLEVDKWLVGLGWIDLVEDTRRAVEPVLHILPGDRHGLDGIGVEVEVGDVLDRDRTHWNVGVVVGATTAAGL